MKFLRPLFLGLIILCAAHSVLDAADDWFGWLWPPPPSSPEPSPPSSPLLSAPLSPLLAPSPAQQGQREESSVYWASIFGFKKENLEFRIMPISDETYFIAFVLDKKSAENKDDFYNTQANEIYTLLSELMRKKYGSSVDIAQAIYENIQPKIEVIKKENAGAKNLIIALSFENYRPFLLYNYTFPSGAKLELVPVFSFGDKKGNYFSTDVNYVNNVAILDKWSYSSGAPDRHLQYLILVNNNLYKIWKDIHSPLLFDSIFKEATTMHKVAFDLINKTRLKRAEYSGVMMAAVIDAKLTRRPSPSEQERAEQEKAKEKKITELQGEIKEKIAEREVRQQEREKERVIAELAEKISVTEKNREIRRQEKQKEEERAEQEKAKEKRMAELQGEIEQKEKAREIKQREREREREEQEEARKKEIRGRIDELETRQREKAKEKRIEELQ